MQLFKFVWTTLRLLEKTHKWKLRLNTMLYNNITSSLGKKSNKAD